MQKPDIILDPTARLYMSANLKDKVEIEQPIIKLKIIICFAEMAKILEIAAGKINKAVISKIPTIFTDKAIVIASKIKKDKFQNCTFTPSILAKSALILIINIFLKA